MLGMERALVHWVCRDPCLSYTEVTNEDSSLMDKVKLRSTSTAHVFHAVSDLVGEQGGAHDNTEINSCPSVLSLVGNRMMPQNKAPIHHAFPAPEEETRFQILPAMLCKEAKRPGRTWMRPSSLVDVGRTPVNEA